MTEGGDTTQEIEDAGEIGVPRQGGFDLWAGIFLTVVILGLTGWYLGLRSQRPLVADPSAVPVTSVELLLRSTIADVGQFVSGIAGALAFLWIILTYRQQSRQLELQRRELQLQRRELIISRAALQLQAQELRNSVEQQRELVGVTRQQVEAELESLQEQRRKELSAAEPRFLFQPGGGSSGSQGTTHTFDMFNEGATVTDVRVAYVPPLKHSPLASRVAVIPSGKYLHQLHFQNLPQTPVTMIFQYVDRFGRQGEKRFRISIENSEPSILPINQTGG